MSDNKRICRRCGGEIYHHQGVGYFGDYIAHRVADDCTTFLKSRIEELELSLSHARERITYINVRGTIGVPLDLWDLILNELRPVDHAVFMRAAELDAYHKEIQNKARRSMAEQIQAGGHGQPYN